MAGWARRPSHTCEMPRPSRCVCHPRYPETLSALSETERLGNRAWESPIGRQPRGREVRSADSDRISMRERPARCDRPVSRLVSVVLSGSVVERTRDPRDAFIRSSFILLQYRQSVSAIVRTYCDLRCVFDFLFLFREQARRFAPAGRSPGRASSVVRAGRAPVPGARRASSENLRPE